MPSFDIVSKTDAQLLDNAINVARKEIITRFDFKDTKSTIELNKKDMMLHITTENDMRLNSIEDIVRSRMIKQKLDPSCLDLSKEHFASGTMIKKDIKVKNGIDKEVAKKIVKAIKDLKVKVEAQIMQDQIRVTAKKIDDLQFTIANIRNTDFEQPLQFINMK